jgi:hypothetical protein
MRGWTRAPGLALVTLLGSVSLGCRDNGLPDRNLPLDQAQSRTYSYPAYQAYAGQVEVWEVAGQRWQATAPIETIEPRLLQSVTNANGTPVYALAWDRAPYDRLYTPVGENRWRVIQRVE